MSARVLCLALVLATSLPIHAGCLATPTINSAYDSAPLVFRARVMQITPVPPPPPPPLGMGRGTDAEPMDHLRLQVLEVFKGDPGTEITVLGGDPQFGKGGEFLVFIMPREDNPKASELVVSACSRTGAVTNSRAAADLTWLRAHLSTSPASAQSTTNSAEVGPGHCPKTPVPVPTSVPTGGDFIELQRTACFGWCPAYTVRLYGDGRLTWHGEKYVNLVGDATATLDGIQARSLLEQIQTKGFWGLCRVYFPHATDGPTSITTVSIGGQARTVRETGPSDAPSWLRDIGKQLDSLDSVKKWIGTPQPDKWLPRPEGK